VINTRLTIHAQGVQLGSRQNDVLAVEDFRDISLDREDRLDIS
jgi:hypothetical protein